MLKPVVYLLNSKMVNLLTCSRYSFRRRRNVYLSLDINHAGVDKEASRLLSALFQP